jgi:nucleoside-diphosphate-sugar epimerase
MMAPLRAAFEDRRVCLTGGAGFIGGHLLDALLSLGTQVVVLDDLSNASAAHVAEMVELTPDRCRFVHGSILDDEALAEATTGAFSAWNRPGGADVVFHLAALGSVPRSIEEPQRTWAVNATGTVRVLEQARAAGARRIVFAASSSAYGDSERLPKDEMMLAQALSPYAASKLAGESLMHAWARSYGASTVSLRYFNVFGPRQPADSAYAAVVAALAARLLRGEPPLIYGDGRQTRDFTYIANVVLASLQAGASRRPMAGEVINVGTGRQTSVRQLADTMAAIIGSGAVEPEFRPERIGDVRHSLADISRARELLGYDPFATLEQGLEETIAWFQQHGPPQVTSHEASKAVGGALDGPARGSA